MASQPPPLRFITAASLFDGHDVSINMMRRLLQAAGVEVIHLGHHRSAQEIVQAAIQEDVQGIAISSYQGGHNEFFAYVMALLHERGVAHINVFGGGGGVITPPEIEMLLAKGVTRIYTPEDGQHLGLVGIVQDMVARAGEVCCAVPSMAFAKLSTDNDVALAQHLSGIENNSYEATTLAQLAVLAEGYQQTPVLGITGTGGAGKSSLTDELLQRFRLDQDDLRIAVLALDPTRRKTGGALLGDRIRMNALSGSRIFMRSFAMRNSPSGIVPQLKHLINVCKVAGYDLIMVETPGVGQGDASIVPLVDVSLYVMTPEFGAASQLEKIQMLDEADAIAINKFDKRGSADAWHDVAKQMQRNREVFQQPLEDMPVFGTVASHFNDAGVTALYQYLLQCFNEKAKGAWATKFADVTVKYAAFQDGIIPAAQQGYLGAISDCVRTYHKKAQQQAKVAKNLQALKSVALQLNNTDEINQRILTVSEQLSSENKALLDSWPEISATYQQQNFTTTIRGKTLTTQLSSTSLSGLTIPKVILPSFTDDGALLTWLLKENRPGEFPFTAGVFHFKREGEAPGRMFAGEGDCFRTNKRFKYLSKHADAKRLSTAFDSVTLYGFDPASCPDIYGKIGNAGVSIASLDDMRALFDGFDLCDPKTSVSMTINGPAPTILAMFLNVAIEQQQAKFPLESAEEIKARALQQVRGTVQADILKEDQAQNTCIFSTEFSLKMMGDVEEYFVRKQINHFYSVSISGYHIAEAGANPISQLAFTLANGFTYVEAYLARGMHIDDFAPHLSFFFSNGMDPEYTVMGRVARRIWAVAMRERYGANKRSQQLKYHIQTSGRSLHAQEMAFNDIRTTLQALEAFYDNCNSLHTNAYDEAMTTPTEDSLRRAMAIQLIINEEYGLAKNQNPLQGAFIIDYLTDVVEAAVLDVFDDINRRGGVLGAMESAYQRAKIQDESLLYEKQKNDGSLPIIGVNAFVGKAAEKEEPFTMELARSTEAEKQSQLQRLAQFHEQHETAASQALQALKEAAIAGDNVFAVLMETVKVCSLGQITQALFEVGGQYRRHL